MRKVNVPCTLFVLQALSAAEILTLSKTPVLNSIWKIQHVHCRGTWDLVVNTAASITNQLEAGFDLSKITEDIESTKTAVETGVPCIDIDEALRRVYMRKEATTSVK